MVPNCSRPYHAKGLCNKHYNEKRKSEFSPEQKEHHRQLNNKRSEKYRNNPKNKEKISNRQKNYYSKSENREKKNLDARKRYNDPVKGKIIKNKRKIYQEIPEVKSREKNRTSTYNRLYGIENREKINKNRKINRDNNKDSINKQRNTSRNKKYFQYRIKLLKILGDKCQNCGIEVDEVLDIEHILDTGHKDKKKFYRKDDFFRFYSDRPLEARKFLQIFCHNCNVQKEHRRRSEIRKNNKKSQKRFEIEFKTKHLIFDLLNQHKCNNCGYKNFEVLERDHIHDDGKQDRIRFNNNSNKMWKYYISNPEECMKKIQILCANCNAVKSRFGLDALKKLMS